MGKGAFVRAVVFLSPVGILVLLEGNGNAQIDKDPAVAIPAVNDVNFK